MDKVSALCNPFNTQIFLTKDDIGGLIAIANRKGDKPMVLLEFVQIVLIT